jgi:hypothetical protein
MSAVSPESRRESLTAGIRRLVRAVSSDDDQLLDAFLRITRSHRLLAPLAFMVGALAMLLDGLRLLLTNWRLVLIQVPPAMWVWLAMYDLRAHVLHGKSFNEIRGPILIPIGLAIVAITAAGFFLNAVFAFAVTGERPPRVGTAFARAREHARPILSWGAGVGAALAVATTVAPRWGHPWFALLLGIVVGVMMICYVAIPARTIGVKKSLPPREKLTVSLLSSGLGATVSAPGYLLGRVGILMFGSPVLLVPGIVVFMFGATLQAGATGAVRAIKLSAALSPAETGRVPPKPA